MTLKNKWLILIVALIALFVIAILMYIKIELKGTAPADLPAPEEQGPSSGQKPSLGHAIPSNVIPGVQEIEKSIKKSEETRRISDEMLSEIEHLKAGVISEDEIAKEETATPPVEEEKPSVALPARREIKFPTKEEIQKMKAQGIELY